MVSALHTWAPVIIATIASLPVALLIAWGLASLRSRRGADAAAAWRGAVLEVAIAVGTLPWIWMILTPRPGPAGVELMLGEGLSGVLAAGTGVAAVQIGGNLLVFASFGALAPIRWRMSIPVIMAVAAAGSTMVELLQFSLNLGRVSSIDDIVLNVAGAALAASATWWFTSAAGRSSRNDRTTGPDRGVRRGT